MTLYHPFNILRHVHPEAAGRIVCGGGGKGGGTTTSTVTQQDIPEEFFPYFERMLARGESASLEPYIPYDGARMAGQTDDTLASQDMIRNIAFEGQPALDFATGLTAQNAAEASAYGGQPAYQFSPFGDFQEFGFSGPGQFTGDAVGEYMSPYIQNVLDLQKERATEDYLTAQGGRSAAAVSAGAFGGSRQQVAESMAERGMLDRMRDIDATGMQSAYTDAQRMFEADRAARFQTEGARAAEAARVQGGNAAELARVQGSQAGENLARDEFGLQALGQSSNMAGQLAALAEQARAGDIQAAQLLELVGRSNEARSQAELDLAYEDFVRQTDYPMERLQQLSAMLHGLPIQAAGTTTNSVPYNPIQQALGTGISALGLYKAMG
jgi:hypothetical protein